MIVAHALPFHVPRLRPIVIVESLSVWMVAVTRPADDTLNGTAGADTVCGLKGNDTLNGMGGADHVLGAAGNDVLTGGGGPDVIKGAGGNDTLHGTDGVGGNDTVNGGNGTDTCDADAGDTRKSCP